MFEIINSGKMPTRGTRYSACVDLYANEDVVIGAGETVIVPLGVKIKSNLWDFIQKTNPITYKGANEEYFMQTNYLQLSPRSSLRAKGLISGQGIIDLDYNKEIKMIVTKSLTMFESINNDYSEEFIIKRGDKIAQITLLEHKSYLFDIDSQTKRDGGLGSTDKQ